MTELTILLIIFCVVCTNFFAIWGSLYIVSEYNKKIYYGCIIFSVLFNILAIWCLTFIRL